MRARNFIRLLEGRSYKPRQEIPGWRGELTTDKILRVLKTKIKQSCSGQGAGWRFVQDFETPEELEEHTYWHGSGGGVSGGLKPSIAMSDRDVMNYGGGGYGQKYWGISVTKDKQMASRFVGQSSYGHVYMVLLHKNAVVKSMEGQITDSVEIEDHIVELWKEGVDAVWIGGGEEELVILNPKAVWIGPGESFRVFNQKRFEQPEAQDIWDKTRGLEVGAKEEQKARVIRGARNNVTRWEDFKREHPRYSGMPEIEKKIEKAKARVAELEGEAT